MPSRQTSNVVHLLHLPTVHERARNYQVRSECIHPLLTMVSRCHNAWVSGLNYPAPVLEAWRSVSCSVIALSSPNYRNNDPAAQWVMDSRIESKCQLLTVVFRMTVFIYWAGVWRQKCRYKPVSDRKIINNLLYECAVFSFSSHFTRCIECNAH